MNIITKGYKIHFEPILLTVGNEESTKVSKEVVLLAQETNEFASLRTEISSENISPANLTAQ